MRPLATALINEGLNVWYDEMTLRIGDSLRQKIDKGLANSRVGLVVLREFNFEVRHSPMPPDGTLRIP
ncbi:toll/interleukin-1 receptor domain-containing protein [Aeromonas sp. ASNIH3]|uniref:toll/interleukin-1 receptor domain-containing protein n=1 Tax=Aeromonas sp. ASNIH3 TaxID=1636608 RepID=UPI002D795CF4|nr:toll/interleukin-1 receptor domain-containing protein [Aeromonas sp. ASNIH3]